jgi:hypothetical protein
MKVPATIVILAFFVGIGPLSAQGRQLELADAQEQGLIELTIIYSGDPYFLDFAFKSLSSEELRVFVPSGYIAGTGPSATSFLFISPVLYPVAAGSSVRYTMPVAALEPDLDPPAIGTEFGSLKVDDKVIKVLRQAQREVREWNKDSAPDPRWDCECLRAMLWIDPELGKTDAGAHIAAMEEDQGKRMRLVALATSWLLKRTSQSFGGE